LADGSIGTYLSGIVYQNMAWIGVIAICVILSMVNLILAIFGIQYIKNSNKH